MSGHDAGAATTMLGITDEHLEWQARARTFAEEEIRPISLERDQIQDLSLIHI